MVQSRRCGVSGYHGDIRIVKEVNNAKNFYEQKRYQTDMELKDVKKLQKLLKADKNIKSAQTLFNKLVANSTSEITEKINKYNPEK